MLNNIRILSTLCFNFRTTYQFARHHKEIVWMKDITKGIDHIERISDSLPSNENEFINEIAQKNQSSEPQSIPTMPKDGANKIIEKQKDGQRLSKYLSNTGICSRRQAEKLIEQGMIYVDKKQVTQNIQVNQNSAIKVFTKQGEKVPLPRSSKIWLFYKPVGLICSHEDPQGRPTVYDFVKKELKITSHIISVGRLDYNSEGLLIVTNDGSIARVMELPASQIEREYRVRVFGRFDEDKLRNIQKGAIIAGVQYGPFFCRVERRQTKNTWLIIRMETGKNREIRKVMRKFQLQVNRIIRTRFGPYTIGDLKPGQIIETEIDSAIKRKLYLMMRKDLQQKDLQKEPQLQELQQQDQIPQIQQQQHVNKYKRLSQK